MMQRLLAKLGLSVFLLWAPFAFSGNLTGSGPLFTVSATGIVNITLCLNGKAPLSCQNYNVPDSSFSVSTTILNRTYPTAGIKINTPGYTFVTSAVSCVSYLNGYCLFSVSKNSPQSFSIHLGGEQTRVAVGGNQTYPSNSLSYTSTNAGESWTSSTTEFSDEGLLISVACDDAGKICTSVGAVVANNTYPTDSLSYTSTDGGVSWTRSATLFSDGGVLYSVACDSTGKTCTAVGALYSSAGPTNSLSYTSTDGGVNWTRSTTLFSDGGDTLWCCL